MRFLFDCENFSVHVSVAGLFRRAGQKALLNNSPLIVLKDGQLVLALGTPGADSQWMN